METTMWIAFPEYVRIAWHHIQSNCETMTKFGVHTMIACVRESIHERIYQVYTYPPFKGVHTFNYSKLSWLVLGCSYEHYEHTLNSRQPCKKVRSFFIYLSM